MQRIIPNIWCRGNAAEVGQLYADAFASARTRIESRYPETGLADFQQEFAGDPLTVAVEIDTPGSESFTRLTLINAGEEFVPNPAISLMVNFDPGFFEGSHEAAREALDTLHRNLLTDGGIELMPLGEYPFSAHYAWVQDRFGVSWQLIVTDPAGDPRPFIIPSLMFSGPAQNHAGEAIGLYLDTFGAVFGAELGQHIEYAQKTGPAEPGTVQFADFQVGDDWLVAMDSGAEQDFTFGAAVSLEVQCRDQDEIDRVWESLSANPEAEVCGWLQDRFGVSWQIVPENMGDLMERPGAWQTLSVMKKIVIADF